MNSGIYLILLLLVCGASFAQSYDDCLLGKYTEYSEAKIQWQEDLANLIIAHDPTFEEVAENYKSIQLLMIEQSMLSFKVLLKNEPNKLRTHMALNNWLSFSSFEIKELAKSDHRLGEVHSKIMDARDRPPIVDGDRLRSVMQKEIFIAPKYEALLINFKKNIRDIEGQACKKT